MFSTPPARHNSSKMALNQIINGPMGSDPGSQGVNLFSTPEQNMSSVSFSSPLNPQQQQQLQARRECAQINRDIVYLTDALKANEFKSLVPPETLNETKITLQLMLQKNMEQSHSGARMDLDYSGFGLELIKDYFDNHCQVSAAFNPKLAEKQRRCQGLYDVTNGVTNYDSTNNSSSMQNSTMQIGGSASSSSSFSAADNINVQLEREELHEFDIFMEKEHEILKLWNRLCRDRRRDPLQEMARTVLAKNETLQVLLSRFWSVILIWLPPGNDRQVENASMHKLWSLTQIFGLEAIEKYILSELGSNNKNYSPHGPNHPHGNVPLSEFHKIKVLRIVLKTLSENFQGYYHHYLPNDIFQVEVDPCVDDIEDHHQILEGNLNNYGGINNYVGGNNNNYRGNNYGGNNNGGSSSSKKKIKTIDPLTGKTVVVKYNGYELCGANEDWTRCERLWSIVEKSIQIIVLFLQSSDYGKYEVNIKNALDDILQYILDLLINAQKETNSQVTNIQDYITSFRALSEKNLYMVNKSGRPPTIRRLSDHQDNYSPPPGAGAGGPQDCPGAGRGGSTTSGENNTSTTSTSNSLRRNSINDVTYYTTTNPSIVNREQYNCDNCSIQKRLKMFHHLCEILEWSFSKSNDSINPSTPKETLKESDRGFCKKGSLESLLKTFEMLEIKQNQLSTELLTTVAKIPLYFHQKFAHQGDDTNLARRLLIFQKEFQGVHETIDLWLKTDDIFTKNNKRNSFLKSKAACQNQIVVNKDCLYTTNEKTVSAMLWFCWKRLLPEAELQKLNEQDEEDDTASSKDTKSNIGETSFHSFLGSGTTTSKDTTTMLKDDKSYYYGKDNNKNSSLAMKTILLRPDCLQKLLAVDSSSYEICTGSAEYYTENNPRLVPIVATEQLRECLRLRKCFQEVSYKIQDMKKKDEQGILQFPSSHDLNSSNHQDNNSSLNNSSLKSLGWYTTEAELPPWWEEFLDRFAEHRLGDSEREEIAKMVKTNPFQKILVQVELGKMGLSFMIDMLLDVLKTIIGTTTCSNNKWSSHGPAVGAALKGLSDLLIEDCILKQNELFKNREIYKQLIKTCLNRLQNSNSKRNDEFTTTTSWKDHHHSYNNNSYGETIVTGTTTSYNNNLSSDSPSNNNTSSGFRHLGGNETAANHIRQGCYLLAFLLSYQDLIEKHAGLRTQGGMINSSGMMNSGMNSNNNEHYKGGSKKEDQVYAMELLYTFQFPSVDVICALTQFEWLMDSNLLLTDDDEFDISGNGGINGGIDVDEELLDRVRGDFLVSLRRQVEFYESSYYEDADQQNCRLKTITTYYSLAEKKFRFEDKRLQKKAELNVLHHLQSSMGANQYQLNMQNKQWRDQHNPEIIRQVGNQKIQLAQAGHHNLENFPNEVWEKILNVLDSILESDYKKRADVLYLLNRCVLNLPIGMAQKLTEGLHIWDLEWQKVDSGEIPVNSPSQSGLSATEKNIYDTIFRGNLNHKDITYDAAKISYANKWINTGYPNSCWDDDGNDYFSQCSYLQEIFIFELIIKRTALPVLNDVIDNYSDEFRVFINAFQKASELKIRDHFMANRNPSSGMVNVNNEERNVQDIMRTIEILSMSISKQGFKAVKYHGHETVMTKIEKIKGELGIRM